ncbi:MAG: hypothetical protein RLZZ140_613, partial [Pseudomonadota bacterium]
MAHSLSLKASRRPPDTLIRPLGQPFPPSS